MLEYKWFASICSTVEKIEKIREANIALELDAYSKYIVIKSNTIREGERLFCERKEFDDYCSKHSGRTVYVYYINELGFIECVR